MEFQFCFDRCQRMPLEVCENRLKKGKCKKLDTPKELDAKTRAFLGYEKGEVKMACEEVG